MDLEDLSLQAAHKEYLNFIDDKSTSRNGVYFEKVQNMIRNKKHRLIIDINDLRSFLPDRVRFLFSHAVPEIVAFQKALKEFVRILDSTFIREIENFFVGFDGCVRSQFLNPRLVNSYSLNKLLCIEGIVTKISFVHPKILRSVHYCPNTDKILERRYSDQFSFESSFVGTSYPTKDEDGNPLETEFGLSIYKDYQTITIQELPETAPPGQLPRSIDAILEDDLVDLAKAGDRVYLYGIYCCIPNKRSGYTSGSFRTVILVNNIQIAKEEIPQLSSDDVSKIRSVSKLSNIFQILSNSIAPSISGHPFVKKAILCLLLGGVEKTLQNGTRLRGDINILLIGDPSTAKSQILRYVFHTLPRAITTTGRGSSGVGLTAAITTDVDTNERILEAGAMVLADRGVVCIDEFDKMNDIDRTAIHEVMEQGRVTISKAGIHARLNARCSVLAAANPVYGQYDEFKTPMDNIGLQDSLLSRFDLIFILLDNIDIDGDKRIAEHVIRMHRFRSEFELDGESLPLGRDELLIQRLSNSNRDSIDFTEDIFEKFNEILHGSNMNSNSKIFTLPFFIKYVQVARALKPSLTITACELISTEYTRLRSHDISHIDIAKTQPVTARTLESLIRISTAHAKSRISKYVEAIDVEVAISLINYAYFKDVLLKNIGLHSNDLGNIYEDNQSITKSPAACERKINDTQEMHDISEDLFDEKFLQFQKHAFLAFSNGHVESLMVAELYSSIHLYSSDHLLTNEIFMKYLCKMEESNKIMVSEGVVYLI